MTREWKIANMVVTRTHTLTDTVNSRFTAKIQKAARRHVEPHALVNMSHTTQVITTSTVHTPDPSQSQIIMLCRDHSLAAPLLLLSCFLSEAASLMLCLL